MTKDEGAVGQNGHCDRGWWVAVTSLRIAVCLLTMGPVDAGGEQRSRRLGRSRANPSTWGQGDRRGELSHWIEILGSDLREQVHEASRNS